jgi:hypothetical protein
MVSTVAFIIKRFSFIFHYKGTANFPNRQENLEKFFSFYKDFSKNPRQINTRASISSSPTAAPQHKTPVNKEG